MLKKIILGWILISVLLTGRLVARVSSEQGYPESGFPADQIKQSIILAGDGGDMGPEVAALLKAQSEILSDRLSIIFLGDNIYPAGLPPEGDQSYAKEYEKLNRQMAAVKDSKAKTIFIPGNHDWEHGFDDTPDGLQKLSRQQRAIEAVFGADSFLPKDGCPGPVSVSLGKSFQLIILDSEWWFYLHEKPQGEKSKCSANDEGQIVEQLTKLIKESPKDRKTILAVHHPLISYGSHRYKFARQDYLSEEYKNYYAKISRVLEENPVDVCAGGHDHSLQILGEAIGCRNSIVSAALTETKKVRRTKLSRLASTRLGFMRLDLYNDGKVRISVFSPSLDKPGSVDELYRQYLD